jgi:hypothetical protein
MQQKSLVIGWLAATTLLVSSQSKALDREGAFDALLNAAIYTKLCGGVILANTQKYWADTHNFSA